MLSFIKLKEPYNKKQNYHFSFPQFFLAQESNEVFLKETILTFGYVDGTDGFHKHSICRLNSNSGFKLYECTWER